jgi:hypothetical protein
MQSEVDDVLTINLYLNTHPLVWRLEDALQGRDAIEVCPQLVRKHCAYSWFKAAWQTFK